MTTGAIMGFPAAGFALPPLSALLGQSPHCSFLGPWPLALGSWPRSHFTHPREADTSGLGCVVQHNSWTAAAVPLFPFQKKNKNESSRGVRQALQALTESREAVLNQPLKGPVSEVSRPKPLPLCAPLPGPSSPLVTPFP